MNVKQFVYFGLALLSVGFMAAQAAMPNTIQVQGRVSVNGTNYSGTGNFKFALVMHPVAHRRQATARAVRTGQFITSIEMEDGGSGYYQAPFVNILAGGGSGATATAIVSGGAVVEIVMNSAGSGYTFEPYVEIGAPTEPDSWISLWSNDGTSLAGSEPEESYPVPVSRGLYTVRLGDGMQALDTTIFRGDELYLRTWFSDGTGFSLLEPDQPIGAVPYAMHVLNEAPHWEDAVTDIPNVVSLESEEWLRIRQPTWTYVWIDSPVDSNFHAKVEGASWEMPQLGIVAPETTPYLYEFFGVEPGVIRYYGKEVTGYGYTYSLDRRKADARVAHYLSEETYHPVANPEGDSESGETALVGSQW